MKFNQGQKMMSLLKECYLTNSAMGNTATGKQISLEKFLDILNNIDEFTLVSRFIS